MHNQVKTRRTGPPQRNNVMSNASWSYLLFITALIWYSVIYTFMFLWCIGAYFFRCSAVVVVVQCAHTYSWLAFPILGKKNTVCHRAFCQVKSADWCLKSVARQRCRVNRTYRCPRHVARVLSVATCSVCDTLNSQKMVDTVWCHHLFVRHINNAALHKHTVI